MTVPVLTLFLFISLTVEKYFHQRRLRAIPMRICVTGTRGKSSVTRMIASVLRESGRRVVAKTTGSQPCVILPDGSETEIARRGRPTILEQKMLVRRAVRLRADCLVAELMSIHPENHYVEAHHLLQPGFVVVTNVRRDHTAAMGTTEGDIAAVLSMAVPQDADLFLPEATAPYFRCHGVTHTVPESACEPLLAMDAELPRREFINDLNLVYALSRHLGISDDVIHAGILNTRHDIGRFKIWTLRSAGGTQYLVNAFAANDPDSTARALARARQMLPEASGIVGILNLRADRPDRTSQWIADLQSGALGWFRTLFVTGASAAAVRRRLRTVRAIASTSPAAIMAAVTPALEERSIILGFGNMAGAGRALVDYWSKTGEPYVH